MITSIDKNKLGEILMGQLLIFGVCGTVAASVVNTLMLSVESYFKFKYNRSLSSAENSELIHLLVDTLIDCGIGITTMLLVIDSIILACTYFTSPDKQPIREIEDENEPEQENKPEPIVE